MAHGVEPGRIFLMPLGVDAERFRPAAARTATSAPPASRSFRALFTGQMTVRKGVHLLLEAWARVAGPEDELLFAGYPADPFIQERVAHAPGGRRRYLGFVPHERLHEVYRQADIFVFPSLAEGGVYVIYEALASGLPCIVSENAGSAVRDGVEGFVVPAGDVDALADRIRRLKEDEALRRRMALAAHARGEAMSWPNFYRRGGLMYREILRRDGATGEGVFDLFER
jgi:glycosyltransferase involved in cell wall biosynthesis